MAAIVISTCTGLFKVTKLFRVSRLFQDIYSWGHAVVQKLSTCQVLMRGGYARAIPLTPEPAHPGRQKHLSAWMSVYLHSSLSLAVIPFEYPFTPNSRYKQTYACIHLNIYPNRQTDVRTDRQQAGKQKVLNNTQAHSVVLQLYIYTHTYAVFTQMCAQELNILHLLAIL